LPLTIPIVINNFLLKFKKKKKYNIKTICVGKIYVGGTGKTPLSIKINQLLKKLNFKTAIIKKFYLDQVDEQKLLKNNAKLFCKKNRYNALKDAIDNKIDVAIFDDGLQDKSINYDLSFVCFNTKVWIGNGMLIPAGPLREKIKSLKKYDVVFLNGNSKNIYKIKSIIKKNNPKIKIFETMYEPTNIKKFSKKQKYVIFSGIGNSESFAETVGSNKLTIVKELRYPDHYKYTKNDIYKIIKIAKKLNAKILTTEKDYMKLEKFKFSEINFLKISVSVKNENKLIKFLIKKL